jgi:hypothetical protein
MASTIIFLDYVKWPRQPLIDSCKDNKVFDANFQPQYAWMETHNY